MDPAFASILATSILGFFSVVVAIINTRGVNQKVIDASVKSAVDEATRPLLTEIGRLKALLPPQAGRSKRVRGDSDE